MQLCNELSVKIRKRFRTTNFSNLVNLFKNAKNLQKYRRFFPILFIYYGFCFYLKKEYILMATRKLFFFFFINWLNY